MAVNKKPNEIEATKGGDEPDITPEQAIERAKAAILQPATSMIETYYKKGKSLVRTFLDALEKG